MVAIVKEKFEAVFKNLFKPLSNLTKYVYDKAGRMTSESQEINIGVGTKRTAAKEYDQAGNITKISYPDYPDNDKYVAYTYTGIYQPDEINYYDGSNLNTVADYDYQYDSTGDGDLRPLLETKTLDNCKDGSNHKVALDLKYDAVLRVTSHDWKQNGSTTVGFTYEYDLAGNLAKADHLHESTHDEEFEYDDAYRLTKYIKDPDGSPTNQQWTLDGVYNWTDFTDYGTTETRTHNSVNEVTAIDTNNDADMLYDSNGNLTVAAGLKVYQFGRFSGSTLFFLIYFLPNPKIKINPSTSA